MGRLTTEERLKREDQERRDFRKRAFELVIRELREDIRRTESQIEEYKWVIEQLRGLLAKGAQE